MGLIPQVKCGRCDRTYSGLRSRCPYCGAHRHKKGKRVTDSDNATWKLIIGVLLIVVLIAAVIVILVTGSGEADPDDGDEKKPNNAGDGVENSSSDAKPVTTITVTASDGSVVENISLSFGGTTELTATVTSSDGTANTITPVWMSSNEGVVDATADETGTKCTVAGVGEGTSIVTVTVGDTKKEITVTVGDTSSTGPGSSVPQTVVASGLTVKSKYHELTGKWSQFTVKIAEIQEVTAVITPSNVTSVPTWESSDESVVAVTPIDETGIKARCTGVSQGVATITVTVDAVEFKFQVRCDGKTL